MEEYLMPIILAAISSSSLGGAVTFLVTRHFNKKDKNDADQQLIRETMAALSYSLMSNEIEKLISKGWATSEERRALEILFKVYKKNGWNGDMDARMEIVHHLPFREEDIEC